MKKLLLVLMILALIPAAAVAAPKTIDIETMTAEELTALRDEIDAALASFAPADSDATSTEDAIAITADKLDKAYSGNKLAADKEYKGKLLSVTGVIENIDEETFGNRVFIALKAGGEYSFRNVTCYFSADELDTLASLDIGKKITIVGTCAGEEFMGVELKDCSIPK